MAKLFTSEDKVLDISRESFLEHHKHSKVIATEAIQDFFSVIKDKFSNSYDRLFDKDLEKVAIDATSNKYEVLSVLQRIEMGVIAKETVTIPERFKGLYLPYAKDLDEISSKVVPDTIQLLKTIKLAIAGFINEYKEDGVLSIYGIGEGKDYTRNKEKHLKTMQKYFPHTKSVSKAEFKDVIKSLKDIKSIYDLIPSLSATLSQGHLKEMIKLSNDIADIVDQLIEQNTQSNILVKNSSAKKDLIELIDVGARGVEFSSYLYTNIVHFYTAIKNVGDTIVVVGNR